MRVSDSIPLAYCELVGGRLFAGPASFDGARFSLGDTAPLDGVGCLRTRGRGTVAVTDVQSLNAGEFNPRFVERCRIPGNDVWLIETVRYPTDILDAFLGNLSKLLIPYHTASPQVFRDAIELSDDCIPLVQCWEGRPYAAGENDLLRIVRALADLGYGKVAVSDPDGGVPAGVWNDLADGPAEVVPHSPKGVGGKFGTVLGDLFPAHLETERASIFPNSFARMKNATLSAWSDPPISNAPSHSEPTVLQRLLNIDSVFLKFGSGLPPQIMQAMYRGCSPPLCQYGSKRSTTLFMSADGPLK